MRCVRALCDPHWYIARPRRSRSRSHFGPVGCGATRRVGPPLQLMPSLVPPLVASLARAGICTFFFMSPLISLGATRPLVMSDVPQLPKEDVAEVANARFTAAMDSLRAQHAAGAAPTGWGLLWALQKAQGRKLRWGGLDLVLWVFFYTMQPLFIKGLLVMVEESNRVVTLPVGTPANATAGAALAEEAASKARLAAVPFGALGPVGLWAAMMLVGLLQILCLNNGFYWQYRYAIAVKAALQNAVYKKATQLSSKGRSDPRAGNIGTLIAVDPMRVFGAAIGVHWLWIGWPLIIASVVMVYTEVGELAVVPIGVMGAIVLSQV